SACASTSAATGRSSRTSSSSRPTRDSSSGTSSGAASRPRTRRRLRTRRRTGSCSRARARSSSRKESPRATGPSSSATRTAASSGSGSAVGCTHRRGDEFPPQGESQISKPTKEVRAVSTVQSTVGRFVWHEQVSPDPKQAQDFYAQLFGWDFETWKPGEVDYTMIASGGQTHGGISKALEGAPPPHWLSHVRVENVDDTIEKAKAAAGALAAGPFEMGEIGRMAILADPQGAYISAFQPENEMPLPEGVFVWDELGTSDADGAQRFYEQVFGWTTNDMGPDYGGYRIFNVG